MRVVLAIVCLFGYVCCAFAIPTPTTPKQIDDDIDLVPFKVTNGDQPIIDTSAGFGFGGPFSNPFRGFYENFESLMARVQQQMESLFNRFPSNKTTNFTEGIPDFPNFGELAPFPQFDDIDLGKGNTTSEIKIIDGHKVIINQTEYQKDTENGSAFFKVRVIDVKPQDYSTERDSETVTSPSSYVSKEREPIENSIENEIYKNNEVIFYQPLQRDHVDSASLIGPSNLAYALENSWEDNRIEPFMTFNKNSHAVDLSRDTYVNDLLAQSGATMNPDAEIIEVVPQGSNGRSFPR